MLIADSKDKVNTFKVAFLTGASIFVMGYLNGMALNTHDLGTMITAQSGNVIWLGLNAAGGYWVAFLENIGLLLGFAGGAAFALYTQHLFANKVKQFFFNWSVFIVPILLYPLALQYVAPAFVSFLVLGFSSGAVLGFFRKMYHLEINNAMATGSARFLGLHGAGALHKRTETEIKSFWLFFICVFLFAAGSFLYANMAMIDYALGDSGQRLGLGNVVYNRLSLGILDAPRAVVGNHVAPSNIARIICLFVICFIPYFFCPKPPAKA